MYYFFVCEAQAHQEGAVDQGLAGQDHAVVHQEPPRARVRLQVVVHHLFHSGFWL